MIKAIESIKQPSFRLSFNPELTAIFNCKQSTLEISSSTDLKENYYFFMDF